MNQHIGGHTWKADEYCIEILPSELPKIPTFRKQVKTHKIKQGYAVHSLKHASTPSFLISPTFALFLLSSKGPQETCNQGAAGGSNSSWANPLNLSQGPPWPLLPLQLLLARESTQPRVAHFPAMFLEVEAALTRLPCCFFYTKPFLCFCPQL